MKAWIEAARPRTLPLALSSVFTGNALAYLSDPCGFSFPILLGSVLTTALLQVLSNFANDLGDGEKGTDGKNRIGPERAVQSGKISVKAMRNAVSIAALAGFISGIILLYQAYERHGWLIVGVFFVLGLLSIAAAVFYTMGKFAYGYRAMGDLAVFLFFGLLGVLGTFFLQTGNLDLRAAFGAFAVGALSTGVLNLNNMRDRESDKVSRKWTVAVILGFKRSKWYHYSLIAISVLALTGLAFLIPFQKWTFLLVIPGLFLLLHVFVVFKIRQPIEFDPLLKQLALICFLFSLLLSLQAVLMNIPLPCS